MTDESTDYVQRVSQLDASDLDRELHSLFKDQVTKALKYIKPRYWSKVEPELDALLRLIVLSFSLKTFQGTVGQQLLNIKYTDANTRNVPGNRKMLIFISGLVGAHWLKAREEDFTLALRKWPFLQKNVSKGFDLAEIGIQTTTIINLLWFLFEGKYSAPLERLLGLKPSPASLQTIRQVSYEYLNRELLWHGFAEFFGFFVPFVNIKRIINNICRWLPIEISAPTSESHRTTDDLRRCCVCEMTPTLPHTIGCRHVFCYYCIASNVMSDANYRCPKCGLQVLIYFPYRPVELAD